MAFSATVYETMQVFVPDTWEHFYFNPTLSPFKVPFHSFGIPDRHLAVYHRHFGRT